MRIRRYFPHTLLVCMTTCETSNQFVFRQILIIYTAKGLRLGGQGEMRRDEKKIANFTVMKYFCFSHRKSSLLSVDFGVEYGLSKLRDYSFMRFIKAKVCCIPKHIMKMVQHVYNLRMPGERGQMVNKIFDLAVMYMDRSYL